MQVLPVYGGQGYGVQLSALRRGVHVVVGTPGRIMDHLEKGTLDLTELRFLVLDEADEMLNMGFAEDVETILADTPDDKQVALFSATMPAQIRRLSKKYLHDPARSRSRARPRPPPTSPSATCWCCYPQKVDALTRILEVENFEGMIVFVRTKNETETLAEKLRARGFSAAAINGDVAQNQRERTVNQLKSGKLDILVATDVAARGLDVERISHVVNYDIPTDTESYVHRIGRTGRAGRSGDAISFVTPRERYLLKHIEKATRQPLAQMQLPSVEDVNATRLARFDDAITAALGADQPASSSSATSSPTTCASTTCPRSTSPPRSPSWPRATSRCCSTRPPSGPSAARASAPSRGPRRDRRETRERRPRGRERRPAGDVPDRRRQAAQGRAAPDRRRDRQRGRPVAARTSARSTSAPTSRWSSCPPSCPPTAWDALRATRISGKLIELKKDDGPRRATASARGRRGQRKPRHKKPLPGPAAVRPTSAAGAGATSPAAGGGQHRGHRHRQRGDVRQVAGGVDAGTAGAAASRRPRRSPTPACVRPSCSANGARLREGRGDEQAADLLARAVAKRRVAPTAGQTPVDPLGPHGDARRQVGGRARRRRRDRDRDAIGPISPAQVAAPAVAEDADAAAGELVAVAERAVRDHGRRTARPGPACPAACRARRSRARSAAGA